MAGLFGARSGATGAALCPAVLGRDAVQPLASATTNGVMVDAQRMTVDRLISAAGFEVSRYAGAENSLTPLAGEAHTVTVRLRGTQAIPYVRSSGSQPPAAGDPHA